LISCFVEMRLAMGCVLLTAACTPDACAAAAVAVAAGHSAALSAGHNTGFGWVVTFWHFRVWWHFLVGFGLGHYAAGSVGAFWWLIDATGE